MADIKNLCEHNWDINLGDSLLQLYIITFLFSCTNLMMAWLLIAETWASSWVYTTKI